MNIGKQIAALQRMTVTELRQRHLEAFGEPNRSGHKDYLVKRIAWRLQAQNEGTLSERARRRAEELADDADLRSTMPKMAQCPSGTVVPVKIAPDHDPRLPLPGAVLTRRYKGRTIKVWVKPRGFEYEGKIYRSLSAVAKAVTGTHWNGFHFFNIHKKNGVADE